MDTKDVNTRYYLIDGLRTLCALTVALFHYKNLFGSSVVVESGLTTKHMHEMGIFNALWPIVNQGPLAVLVFWSISGFIFAYVYRFEGKISLRRYFVHRFSRLYPLHLITLLIVASLQLFATAKFHEQLIYQANDLHNFGLHLFFLSGWVGSQDSFNAPIWSVSVELAVYVAFFLALRLIGINWVSTTLMLGFSAVLMIGTDSLIPVCGFYFFSGVAAWIVLFNIEKASEKAIPLIVVLVLGILPVIVGFYLPGLPLTLLLSPLLFSILCTIGYFEQRLPKLAFLGPVGNITYSIYLLHTPLQMIFILAMLAGLVPAASIVHPFAPLAYIAVLTVAGLLCFQYIEKPAQRYLRRLA